MAMAMDPVCGMQVDTDKTQFSAEHDGKTYYFCAKGCMLDFLDEPERYLAADYKAQGMEGMSGH